MKLLSVDGVVKRFGSLTALHELTLEVRENEFFCIVGPSNAGKSTLLKTIAGLHRPDSGTVSIRGRDVTRLAPKQRRVSLLFQNIALFPNLTGFENIAFPLVAAGLSKDEIRIRVHRIAEMLAVPHVLLRYPRTFSGGEQQRVAIGRSIVGESDLLMLDEPLSNLDARIRIAMRLEFKMLRKEMAGGILYVTHDHIEAMSLSDRLAVLHQGRIQQIGTPEEIYRYPINRVVARLFGAPPMNIIPVRINGSPDGPQLAGDGFCVTVNELNTLGAFPNLPTSLALGLPAESITVTAAKSRETPFHGEVLRVEHLGNKSILDIRLGGGIVKAVVAPDQLTSGPGPVWLGFTPDARHLMDRDSGQFLR